MIATIDIGTNTVLLLLAERRDGLLCAVDERATITRLGEGVDKTRRLKPEAIARTRACLEEYARLCKGAEKIAVVGTSAMRDAGGGEEIRRAVKELFGVEARTISGDEEARLTFIGGTSGLKIDGEATVFDIGGGSTEIVVGKGKEISFAHSFDIGSVRLTERHGEDLEAIRAAAREMLAPLQNIVSSGELVGIAGTVTTLAAVALKMEPYDGARVHGHVMSREEIEEVVLMLAKTPLADRNNVRGLEPKRADVIVAGGAIVLEVMSALGRAKTRVSDRGVRWGLCHELSEIA